MAYSLDPATREITVPKSDLVNISGTLFVLDTEVFRNNMNAIIASEDYIWLPDYATRNAPVTVAGVTLAQTIELINGFNLTFDDSSGTDAYSVRLEGSNNNLFDIQNGILNQNLVQVIPTNSAGLTYSKQIEDTAYLDQRIWIDTVDGLAGTAYPLGTPALPVNTLANAIQIQTSRGLPPRFRGVGTATVASGSLDKFDLLGASHYLSNFTIDPGVPTDETIFERLSLSGTLDGVTVCRWVEFLALAGFAGEAQWCGLMGTVTLADFGGNHDFTNCHSSVAGTTTPTIDCNDIVGLDLSIRAWSGGLKLTNMTDAGSNVSIDMIAGHIVIDPTCTAGTVVVRGDGYVTDNSGVGCTVNNYTSSPAEIWGYAIANLTDSSTIGGYIAKKLLSVSKFLALK